MLVTAEFSIVFNLCHSVNASANFATVTSFTVFKMCRHRVNVVLTNKKQYRLQQDLSRKAKTTTFSWHDLCKLKDCTCKKQNKPHYWYHTIPFRVIQQWYDPLLFPCEYSNILVQKVERKWEPLRTTVCSCSFIKYQNHWCHGKDLNWLIIRKGKNTLPIACYVPICCHLKRYFRYDAPNMCPCLPQIEMTQMTGFIVK